MTKRNSGEITHGKFYMASIYGLHKILFTPQVMCGFNLSKIIILRFVPSDFFINIDGCLGAVM